MRPLHYGSTSTQRNTAGCVQRGVTPFTSICLALGQSVLRSESDTRRKLRNSDTRFGWRSVRVVDTLFVYTNCKSRTLFMCSRLFPVVTECNEASIKLGVQSLLVTLRLYAKSKLCDGQRVSDLAPCLRLPFARCSTNTYFTTVRCPEKDAFTKFFIVSRGPYTPTVLLGIEIINNKYS